MMPHRQMISISALYGEQEDEIPAATCGDQVRIRLRGVEEEDILPGYVLCSPKRPVHCVSTFEAQVVLLDLKSIMTAGFNCVLHVHSAQEGHRAKEQEGARLRYQGHEHHCALGSHGYCWIHLRGAIRGLPTTWTIHITVRMFDTKLSRTAC
jgi:selenocysteine-specific translation elongation factor